MRDMIQKRLLFVAKYLIGLILLGWVLYRVDRRQMLQTLLELKGVSVLAVIFLSTFNIGIQFVRWRYLVSSHSVHFESRDLLPSFFAGFAFRLMLPGGHAEITKVFLLPGRKSGKVVAFTVEKFFQTYIKLLLVLLVFPLFYPDYRWWLWLLAAVVLLAYFFLPALWGQQFMQRFREKEMHYPRIFLLTFCYSLAVYLFMLLQYYILLNDAHTIGWWDTAKSVTMIWGAALLPISVSGLGVRENLAVYFLSAYAIPPSTAVGVALLLFGFNMLLPALIGVVFIVRRRRELKEAGGAIKSATLRMYIRGRRRFKRKKMR